MSKDASTYFDSLVAPQQLQPWFGQPLVPVQTVARAYSQTRSCTLSMLFGGWASAGPPAWRKQPPDEPLQTCQEELAAVATDDILLFHKNERKGIKTLRKLDRAFVKYGTVRNSKKKDVTLAREMTALGCD